MVSREDVRSGKIIKTIKRTRSNKSPTKMKPRVGDAQALRTLRLVLDAVGL